MSVIHYAPGYHSWRIVPTDSKALLSEREESTQLGNEQALLGYQSLAGDTPLSPCLTNQQ